MLFMRFVASGHMILRSPWMKAGVEGGTTSETASMMSPNANVTCFLRQFLSGRDYITGWQGRKIGPLRTGKSAKSATREPGGRGKLPSMKAATETSYRARIERVMRAITDD